MKHPVTSLILATGGSAMVKAAYSPEEEGEDVSDEMVALSAPGRVLGGVFVVAILAIGVFPGAILELFRHALDWAS